MKAALLAIQPVVVDAVVVDGDARNPPPRRAPSSPRAEVTVIHGLAVHSSVGPEVLSPESCWVGRLLPWIRCCARSLVV